MNTLILIAIYFLPIIIAFYRGHASKWAISVVTLLLGFTVIGWFWALIWSLSNRGASQNVVINNVVNGDLNK